MNAIFRNFTTKIVPQKHLKPNETCKESSNQEFQKQTMVRIENIKNSIWKFQKLRAGPKNNQKPKSLWKLKHHKRRPLKKNIETTNEVKNGC